VLDIDDPHVAEAILERTRVGELTTVCRTPRGGLHVYALSALPCHTAKVVAPDGTVLGDLKAGARGGGPGGYVLVWGQVDGRRYEFSWGPGPLIVEDGACWFLELLESAGVQAALDGAPRPGGARREWEWDGEPVPEGRRHIHLVSLAGKLRAAGLGVEAIEAALLAENERRCHPPLPEGEVRSIALSMRGYPPHPNLPTVTGEGAPGRGALPLEALEREVEALPTDYAHGRIIAEALRDRACYVPSWGWMVWTGQRWERDEEADRVTAWAAAVLRDHYIERAREASDPKEQATLLAMAAKCLARAKVAPAIAFAKAWLRANPQDFDQHPYLLNTPNGVVDLATGQLLPHDPGLKLTRMTAAPYDPNADCPTFRRFLMDIFGGNGRLVAYVQRLLGYCLIGGNPERIFPVFWGLGANGKTTLLEAVSHALGDYAQETPPETFMAATRDDVRPRNDLARLHAARLVTASEARSRARLDAAVVKRITGGDRIAARFLFREFFEFVPQFVPILRTNFKPRVAGDDQAVFDRLRLVPFTVRIPPERQDKRLLEKLKAEAPGILRWLVEGCRAYLEGGLQDPPEVLEATARYRAEVDDIYRFLVERTERSPDGSVQASALYAAYRDWVQQEEAEVVGAKRFAEALANLGYERYEAAGKRYYKGLRLKEATPPAGGL